MRFHQVPFFLWCLLMIAVTPTLFAQVNGSPTTPVVSTAENPVYYYIESASNGTVNAGTGTADYRGNLMYAPGSANSTRFKHDKKASISSLDNALWQLVDESGITKLKNKGTGLYMSDSHTGFSSTSSGLIFNSLSSNQFSMRSSNNASFSIAWNNNTLDRWGTSLGVNSQTAWYFIPVTLTNLEQGIITAESLLTSTKAGVHPGQYPEASRTTLTTAINTAKAARDDADPNNDEAALDALNAAITTYQNAQNQLLISNQDNEYWYWIKGTRGSTATAVYAEFQSVGSQVLNKERTMSDKQLWKIVANSSGYALQNKESGAYMNTNINNNALLRTETAIPSGKPIFVNKSSYSTDAINQINYYLVEDNTTSNSVSFRMHAGGSGHNWGLLNYTGGAADNCSFQFLFYDPNDVLSAAINDAESTLTKSVEGTNPGQFTPAHSTTYRSAIDAAIAINNSGSSSSSDKATAAITLNEAKTTFLGSRNPIRLSTTENEYWYYIVSAHTGYGAGQVMTNQNSTAGTSILFRAKSQDPNKLWKFTDMGNGKVSIQNRASSLYISANPRNDGTSSTAAGFNVTWLSEGAQLLMNADGQTYLHAQATGTMIVTWGTSDLNSASAWRLEEIPTEEANIPASITSVTVHQGTYTTTGRGNTDHGMAYATLTTSGYTGSVGVNSLTIDLNGTSSASAVQRLKFYSTGASTRLNPSSHTLLSTVEGPFTTPDPITFTLSSPFIISAGTHHFYLAADIAEYAEEGTIIDNRIVSVGYTDGNNESQTISPATTTTPLYSIVYLTRTVVIQPGDYGSVSYRIPAIATTADGALIALTDKRKHHSGDLPADIDVIAQRSTDNGKTWSAPIMIAQGTGVGQGYGDPVLMKAESGKLITLYVGGPSLWNSTPENPIRHYMSTSDDNGLTWTGPVDITPQLFGAECQDPVRATWRGSFFGSGAGLTMRNGRVMAVIAVIEPGMSGLQNYAVYSDDEGASWKVSNRAITNGDEAKVVELDNGDILMSSRTSGNRLWAKSSDGGINWGTRNSWTEIWGNACDADIIRYTSVLDGYEKSRLLHTLPNASDRRNLSMWISEDEGATWPTKKVLCPGTSAYSSITKLPDGTIGVYFEEDGSVPFTMTFIRFSLDYLTSGNESYHSSSTQAYRTASNGNWSEIENWEIATTTARWVKPTRTPTNQAREIRIMNGHEINIDVVATAATVGVEAGGKLTIVNGSSLTAERIKLKGNSTDGTATLLNSGTLTATLDVEQALSTKSNAESNDNWWYLASPVNNATAAVFIGASSTNRMGFYNEATAAYPQITDAATTLTPGIGYLVQLNEAGIYTFSGTANSGEISIPLMRTGNSQAKRGFNLIGNPYPSYLNWNAITRFGTAERRADIRPTIWYRTRTASGAMVFDTFDGEDGTNNGKQGMVNGMIPPLQAFWVKVNEDNSSTSLLLNDTHRTHNTSTGNALKARSSEENTTNERQIVRLTISNGVNSDVTIISTNPEAKEGLDALDSEKMSVGNPMVPELFTLIGEQELVINKLKQFRDGMNFTLGIRPGTPGHYTLTLTEETNLGSLHCILTDHYIDTQITLSNDSEYTFTSDGSATNDRFSISFQSPEIATKLNDISKALTLTARDGKISILGSLEEGSMIRVYNAMGQQLHVQKATGNYTELQATFNAGIYLVKAGNATIKVTLK